MSSKKRILVVDDEPMVREVVELLLASPENWVATSGSGPEALERLAREELDLVVTDFFMPSMKGDELVRIIKERNPTLPVILITGDLQDLDGQNKAMPECDRILPKPFCMQSLPETVRALLTGA